MLIFYIISLCYIYNDAGHQKKLWTTYLAPASNKNTLNGKTNSCRKEKNQGLLHFEKEKKSLHLLRFYQTKHTFIRKLTLKLVICIW